MLPVLKQMDSFQKELPLHSSNEDCMRFRIGTTLKPDPRRPFNPLGCESNNTEGRCERAGFLLQVDTVVWLQQPVSNPRQ